MPDRDKSWYDVAACRTFRNPQLFHNMSLEGDPVGALAELQSICASCPVFRTCRKFIDEIEYGETEKKCHGFWAGETVKERLARRARARARRRKRKAA